MQLFREKKAEEEVAKGLASAPMTLLSGEGLPDIQALDLTFKPSIGEMTSLALPANLPLDFVASKYFLKIFFIVLTVLMLRQTLLLVE